MPRGFENKERQGQTEHLSPTLLRACLPCPECVCDGQENLILHRVPYNYNDKMQDMDPEYKIDCRLHHISCANWYRSKAGAIYAWNQQVKEYQEQEEKMNREDKVKDRLFKAVMSMKEYLDETEE